jgi:hypothetical protein
MDKEKDNVEPYVEGEILFISLRSRGKISDKKIYNRKIENYESHAKECWSIDEILIK